MLPLNAKEKFEELGSDNNDAREHNSQYQRPRWTAPLRPHIAAARAAKHRLARAGAQKHPRSHLRCQTATENE